MRGRSVLSSVPAAAPFLAALAVAAALMAAFPGDARADSVELGTAADFSVLAGSTVTNTGSSVLDGGNVGVSAGTSVTGFPPGILNAPWNIHVADAVALQAHDDLVTAYVAAAGLAMTQDLTGQDLGGLTLTPGVYRFDSAAQLTGMLTLDSLGNHAALFVFQIGTALTTASNSSVLNINTGAFPGCNVFWQIGSSATLGTDTAFQGHILALASITLNTGASITYGSALAQTGAVTLDSNRITNAVCGTMDSGGAGAALVPLPPAAAMAAAIGGLFWLGRKRGWRAPGLTR